MDYYHKSFKIFVVDIICDIRNFFYKSLFRRFFAYFLAGFFFAPIWYCF